jgi:prevent-host-death family protein
VARTIPANQFRARCSELLDEVAETGEAIVVTKDGRPLARIEPPNESVNLIGSARQLVSDAEFIKPLYERCEQYGPG